MSNWILKWHLSLNRRLALCIDEVKSQLDVVPQLIFPSSGIGKHMRGIFFFSMTSEKMVVFLDTQALFFFFFVLFFPWLYMKPAHSTTVGPVERVRGIKNKDINPVCLPLSRSFSISREVRLRFARLPLRPLCLSWDTLCLFVEAGPSRAACLCVRVCVCIYVGSCTDLQIPSWFGKKRKLSCPWSYHFRLKSY